MPEVVMVVFSKPLFDRKYKSCLKCKTFEVSQFLQSFGSSCGNFFQLNMQISLQKMCCGLIFIFIKLPIRCILNLAAIPSSKVLQVSLGRRSIFKAAESFINVTAISMQINFSHIISFKVASYSACYLTNGVYIRY